jgi:hypothetical protein
MQVFKSKTTTSKLRITRRFCITKTPSQTEKNYYNFFAAANINPEKKKRVNRVKQNRVDYCSRTPNESEQQMFNKPTNNERKNTKSKFNFEFITSLLLCKRIKPILALSLVATKEKQSNHFNGDLKKCKVHNHYAMTEGNICEQLLKTLEITLKRHRGKPLQMETKQNIVGDLLRQRQRTRRTDGERTANDERQRIRQQSRNATA